jgi:transcriptional regulator with XRE-family HTH domain
MKINQTKIKQELERLGWTNTEYADRVGVSRQLLHYYLNKDPKGFRIATRLAKPLHIDPRDLLTR